MKRIAAEVVLAAAICALILLALSSSAAAGVVYVKWNSPGPAFDGKSWDTAYHKMQDGLNAAVSGDEVWVAAGTYTDAVELKEGVGLYGGFAGTEATRTGRNLTANRTLLETPQLTSVTAEAGITAATVIDGFTIAGSSTGIVSYGSPVIRNNTITASCRQIPSYAGRTGISVYGSPTIVNNAIIGDEHGVIVGRGSPRIINNTIVGNGIGGVFVRSSTPDTIVIANNILAFNGTSLVVDSPQGVPTRHNVIYGDTVGHRSELPGPTDICVDPQLTCLRLGDYHIQPSSPCIGAADPSFAPQDDIDGQTRMGPPDIGADQSDGSIRGCPERIIYVDQRGFWGDAAAPTAPAYTTIQEGVEAAYRLCGAEVWVAGGTYREQVWLQPFVHIYGGFSGTESQRDQRNWMKNPTSIEYENTVSDSSVVFGAPVSTIDGFTISGAYYGIYASGNMLTVSHNRISGNTYGIYASSCTSRIINNVIAGNKTGMLCTNGSVLISCNTVEGNQDMGINVVQLSAWFCRATLINNIVTGNKTYGLRVFHSTAVLSRNSVYGNGFNYYQVSPMPDDVFDDPRLASPETGDHHIQPDSPCRDAGNSWTPDLPDLDIDCQPRVQGDGVDIGADESDGTVWPSAAPDPVVYVDSAAPAGGDGTSWQKAFQSLQAGIDQASAIGSAEVWVAAGSYGAISLKTGAFVYGGFRGVEVSRSDRCIAANETRLAECTTAGMGLSVLDGFIIEAEGVAINCGWGSPLISHNTVISRRDAGIALGSCSPTIVDNTIAAATRGVICGWFNAAVIKRNRITGCAEGGIIVAGAECFPSIIDNTITGCGCGILDFAPVSNDYQTSPMRVIFGNLLMGNQDGMMIRPYINRGFEGPDYIGGMITNNMVVGNTNGITIQKGVMGSIANNTVVGNSAVGLSIVRGDVKNNIIAGNGTGILGTGAPITLACNDVYGNDTSYLGVTPGIGDFAMNPLFENPGAGNYHLLPWSPCVDAGATDLEPSLDADRRPRPVDGNLDGRIATDIGAYEFMPNPVPIDILPGDVSNVINLRSRQVTVAVLSTPTFDVRNIDPSTVCFGPGRAVEIHKVAHWQDVNGDGMTDLLLHFEVSASGLTAGDTNATLYGRLLDGERIMGADKITVR